MAQVCSQDSCETSDKKHFLPFPLDWNLREVISRSSLRLMPIQGRAGWKEVAQFDCFSTSEDYVFVSISDIQHHHTSLTLKAFLSCFMPKNL